MARAKPHSAPTASSAGAPGRVACRCSSTSWSKANWSPGLRRSAERRETVGAAVLAGEIGLVVQLLKEIEEHRCIVFIELYGVTTDDSLRLKTVLIERGFEIFGCDIGKNPWP